MSNSLFDRKINPIRQAGLIFAGSLLIMGIGRLLQAAGVSVESLFPWSIATAFTLLFAVFNSMMSLTADNTLRYYAESVYSYLGLAFANGVAAWLISGVSLANAESYRWIYVVITIGFLVFMSMVNLMKRIVQFAEREEWTEPRRRK